MCPCLSGGGSAAALVVAAAMAAVVGAARGAQAATPGNQAPACLVSVTPSDAPYEWRVAARTAEERLRHAKADSDCGAFGIEVAGDRAFVAFTTRDGRQAVRPLASPDEIGPLVDALLVTIPAAPPVIAEAPIPASSPPLADRLPEPVAGTPARVVLHAAGGGRVSSPGGFASPSVNASAGTLVGAWELSAFGRWDPSYVLISGGAPQAFTMSRYAVGVAAGRRVTAGGASITLGMSTGIAVTSEGGVDASQATSGQTAGAQSGGGQTGGAQSGGGQAGGVSAAEPLVGTYVGLVYPRRSPVRLRSELSAEAVASRAGRSLSLDPVLPSLPWWSASASLGVEWEVP